MIKPLNSIEYKEIFLEPSSNKLCKAFLQQKVKALTIKSLQTAIFVTQSSKNHEQFS